MRTLWIALGAGTYLAFVIALLPADAAYRWLAPDDVRLSGVQGTLWSGRAALGSAGSLGFHNIQWDVHLWSILLARPGGRIETGLGDGFLQAEVRIGAGGITISDASASCSLSAFASVLPIAGIRGQVSLQLAELVLRDGWPAAASGQLRLGQLTVPSLVGGGPILLGNFNVTLSGTDGLQGTFEDQGGPLQVRGSADLTSAGDYEIRGLVQARPEADAALRRGIELVTGEPNDAGMRPFNFSGSL